MLRTLPLQLQRLRLRRLGCVAALALSHAFALASNAHAETRAAEKSRAAGNARAHLLIAHGVVSNHIAGRSIGSPTEGHLLGGVRLDDAPYLRVVPVYAAGDVRWGLEALVGPIDRAARAVRKQFPDAVMSFGHLSRPGGGEIDRHASHESGRDADIGFYVKDWAGKPIYADHFVAFKGDGTATQWPGAHFDDARNWAFIAALVGDGRAHLSHIFVATPIRARLLAYAEKIGAPHALRQHAAALMVQPRGSLPHDDHFHVRISCPPSMTGCIELPTVHSDRYARATGIRGRARAARSLSAHAAAAPASPVSPSSPGSLGSLGSPARKIIAPAVKPTHTSDEMPDLPIFPVPPAEPERDAPQLNPSLSPLSPLSPLAPDTSAAAPASLAAPIDDVDGPVPATSD